VFFSLNTAVTPGKAATGLDELIFPNSAFALNADHPVRRELIIAADLTTADEAASGIASVVDERARHPGKAHLASAEAIPAGANISAKITPAPDHRHGLKRRSLGVRPRRQVRDQATPVPNVTPSATAAKTNAFDLIMSASPPIQTAVHTSARGRPTWRNETNQRRADAQCMQHPDYRRYG
jgi:hypothetical protein